VSQPLVVPELARPKAIGDAVELVQARRGDLAEAEAALRSARAGLDAGRAEDRAAYAQSRDHGEDDPGPRHFLAAQTELENAERVHAGEQLRHARAEQALTEALSRHAGSWRQAVARAHERADERATQALAKLRSAEAERAEARALEHWLGQLESTGRLPHKRFHIRSGITDLADPRSSGERMPAVELIDTLQRYIADTTPEARRRQQVEHERSEAEREAAAERVRATRESWSPGVTS
jgi:hypothetical protein